MPSVVGCERLLLLLGPDLFQGVFRAVGGRGLFGFEHGGLAFEAEFADILSKRLKSIRTHRPRYPLKASSSSGLHLFQSEHESFGGIGTLHLCNL
jgi:hypothetical protein